MTMRRILWLLFCLWWALVWFSLSVLASGYLWPMIPIALAAYWLPIGKGEVIRIR